MKILHRIAHLLGWNECRHWEELEWSEVLQSKVLARWGYQCIGCGKVTVVRYCAEDSR